MPRERRGGCQTSSSSGTPSAARRRCIEMLRSHPQIYMPDVKEPWFFAQRAASRFTAHRAPHARDARASTFRCSQAPARSSASARPRRPTCARTAARAHRRAAPDARIIAILREPASFLRSFHLQLLQIHVETERDLAQGPRAGAGPARGAGASRARSHARRRCSTQTTCATSSSCAATTTLFAREQVLVLIYDDFRDDNEATVRRVLRFLDVDDTRVDSALEANPTVRVRSRRLDELMRSLDVGRGPRRARAQGGRQGAHAPRLRRDALRTFQRRVLSTQPAPPDEGLMLRAAPSLQGRGAGAQRVPRSRPR